LLFSKTAICYIKKSPGIPGDFFYKPKNFLIRLRLKKDSGYEKIYGCKTASPEYVNPLSLHITVDHLALALPFFCNDYSLCSFKKLNGQFLHYIANFKAGILY
jgi:hypothetical protein